MSITTTGIRIKTGKRFIDDAVELLSAMRFAVGLLVVVAAASVVGTVIKQNEPFINYVNQFGAFWAELFLAMGLFSVYNATWFLAVMGVLVVSTSLCVTRNSGKMLREAASYKDRLNAAALASFHHKGEHTYTTDIASAAHTVGEKLTTSGYRFVQHARADNAVLIAAKKGTSSRWGYILAHSGMVIILLGGLLDSELPLRVLGWWRTSVPVIGNQLISKVPETGRLPAGTMTYRANVLLPEGTSTNNAVVSYKDGVLVQPLPFELTLKQFNVDYYSTGMPRSFTSDVVVTDPETGKSFARQIRVNEPLVYKGVSVYQSSFDDGGSQLTLRGYPTAGAKAYSFPIKGTVGESTPLQNGNSTDAAKLDATNANAAKSDATKNAQYNVEFTAYRAINVEDLSKERGQDKAPENPSANQSAEIEKTFKNNVANVMSSAQALTGSAQAANKTLKNVGASVQYKLRDTAGQAREFNVYQSAIELDGAGQGKIFLVGMRETPADGFKYLRLPADDKDSVDGYMQFRAAMNSPEALTRAAKAFAQRMRPNEESKEGNSALATQQLNDTALKALRVFATGGYGALAKMIEASVPPAQAEQAADVIVKVLTGVSWDVLQNSRSAAGLAALPNDEASARFLQTAMTAYSDSFFLGAPVLLFLEDAKFIQASVFQVTKSPGKYIVYAGSLLLVLGVFAMFYIRERRLWLWLKPAASGDAEAAEAKTQAEMTHISWAMSAPKRGLDFEQDYAKWQAVFAVKD